MKIDKKLIKELVDNLAEFGLTELEYQEGQTKIKVSKAVKSSEISKSPIVVSSTKSVLVDKEENEGTRIKSLARAIKPTLGLAWPINLGSIFVEFIN